MSFERGWRSRSPREYGLDRHRHSAGAGRPTVEFPAETGYPHRKSPVPHQRPGFGRSDCRVEVTRPGFPLTTHSYRHSVPRMHNVVNRLLTDSSYRGPQALVRSLQTGSEHALPRGVCRSERENGRVGVAAVMVCRRSEENAADVGYYHTEMYYMNACDSAQTRPSTWA